MKNFKKNIRIYREMIKLQLHGSMVFRMDFIGPFFVDSSLFIIQLMAFSAIYSNVDAIGEWGKGEMILYIGTFSMLNAISMVLVFFGLNAIPEKVKSGELDLYLTKPVSPLFRLSLEKFSPGSIPLIIMSLCIIVYGIHSQKIEITGVQLLNYCFWVVLMAILYYDMEVLIRSVSLYAVSTARMDQIEDAGLSLCFKLPGIAFYGVYKVIFYLILPYGIMATFPVQSLIGEMDWNSAFYGVGIVLLFSVLAGVVWKNGLKHYNSASS